ncbi:hypothetical protein EU538_05530 [Candidatus Thorarchaeota archaeon]|nr:MAG: hypothetical protein EU538_05530 [Candidatus Thorarchaeota archaeon]
MSENLPDCTPACENFRCERRPSALKVVRRQGKRVYWCTWVDEECDGPWCQYSVCKERKMTDTGKCRRVEKPVILDEEDDWQDPSEIPKEYAKKIRRKI